ncbi:hypothetical protein BB560_000649 [Smittium megazygosporum]|uniref:L-2-hydroxyglutarate dehydrogenase, mitochondrial n=1 Tax=Smittium megazygosporum TaxID=133381 RepID=A0A2T9ZJS2_9FUNG|nr:hypothetical protein BB560_004136 [Smittium megazygosporum]PVV04838.1 hypothetical protein BB560_000649 [Smittium megazygosporum]
MVFRSFLSNPKVLPLRSVIRCFSSVSKSESESLSVDHLIVGAGVIGLAVARALSQHQNRSVMLVEKNPSFGQETSSRNSGVIHAGMYYPENFLKSKLCIEGRNLLYDYLKVKDIPHKRIGKWIVAPAKQGSSLPTTLTNENEYLNSLYLRAKRLGVPLEFVSNKEYQLSEMSKVLSVDSVLDSPTTGILSQHDYMLSLLQDAQVNGLEYFSNTAVTDILPLKNNTGFQVTLSSNNNTLDIHAQTILNCAGLHSDKVSNMISDKFESEELVSQYKKKLHFFKGSYCSYLPDPSTINVAKHITKLVYPIPHKHLNSLGIHLTKTVDNRTIFGPDLSRANSNTDYSVADLRPATFLNDINLYLPTIKIENLVPDYSGIRPKLSSDEKQYSDFIIEKTFSAVGISGFINLIGIESPGLTSSLAIPKYVDNLI